jgi:hypothetical protein
MKSDCPDFLLSAFAITIVCYLGSIECKALIFLIQAVCMTCNALIFAVIFLAV